MRGKFFLVDKHSRFAAGQIVFRYMPVTKIIKDKPDKTNDIDEMKYFPKYPLYLIIKPYTIDFYLHIPVNFSEEAFSEQHTCILHLPLSLNLSVKDNLSGTLNDIYFSSIKIPEGYEFNNIGFNNAYWDSFDYPEENLNQNGSKQLFLRRLLLDFIYDMEHSTIFEASTFYEEIEVYLKENFVFSAISAKAEYNFNRKIYFEAESFKKSYLIHVSKLFDSEIQLLNILRKEEAQNNLIVQNWFYGIEKEYEKILFNKKFPRTEWLDIMLEKKDEKYFEKNKKILRESARWFLRRYAFLNGYKAISQFYRNRVITLILIACFSFVVFPLIVLNNNKLLYNFFSTNQIEHSVAIIFYEFLGIIPFVILGVIVFWRMVLPTLGMLVPRLMMAIASAWLLFSTTEELVKTSFDVQVFDVYKIWVLLLIIPIIAFMAVEINNMAPDINAFTILRRIFALLTIGFMYSLLIGMFFTNSLTKTMLIRSGYLENFYKTEVGTFSEYNNNVKRFYYKDKEKPLTEKERYEQLRDIKYNFLGKTLQLKYDIPVFKNATPFEKFEIFPGMLMYRAIFAMFIGIFIQLIFEDKPITEPL